MPDSEPPSKRQRAGSNSPPTRSRYWFDDGNIVLQAENTQFCVHRSMLARRSEVFAGMFSIPQPDVSEEPMVENCPVVVVQDKAKDWEVVISLFYDDNRIHDPRKPLSFTHVAAMVRLGQKYEVEYLKTEAIERLQHDFPSTLEDFDALNTEPCRVELTHSHPALISLAHRQQIFSIMPTACFEYVSNTTLAEICSDKKLSSAALRRCVQGRDNIIQHTRSQMIQALQNASLIPSSSCSSTSKCRKGRVMAITYLAAWDVEDGSFKIFNDWDDEEDGPGLCTRCKIDLEKFHDDTRRETWAALPSFFWFTDWKCLLEQSGI